jgi:hypothetical protein
MPRLEQRPVISDLTLKNLSVAEIATELHNVYGTNWFFFEYFHHSCWTANPDDVLEILKQKFNPKSASFRLFGAAQGSKVCCMFRTA